MTRRSKVWLVLAALFTLVNLAGAPMAAAAGEGLHAATHVALMLLGAYLVWRLAPRSGRKDDAPSLANRRAPGAASAVDGCCCGRGGAHRRGAALQCQGPGGAGRDSTLNRPRPRVRQAAVRR